MTEYPEANHDLLFQDAVEELERREAMNAENRAAAAIELDLFEKGPLREFLLWRRSVAAEALKTLAVIPPTATAEIAGLQAAIREYGTICEWIQIHFEKAEENDQIINEEYGENGQTPPEDEG